MNDSGERSVDPAALLVATFTVAVGPLTQPGEWTFLNTVLGVITALIVTAYFLAADNRQRIDNPSRKAALAAVLGLIAATVLAWPLQEAIVQHVMTVGGEPLGEASSNVALGIGAAVGLGLWRRL
jgi:hypothetical protein